MKKFFLMIMGMVTALSVQATEKLWDFSTWDAASFTETTTIDGLTIAATSEATVAVDVNSKNFSREFTKRLKLGGSGKAESRNISFDVSGRSLITVLFMNSGDATDRAMLLAKNEFSNIVKTTPVGPTKDNHAFLTYYHKGGDAKYYLYSKTGGLNIYAIYVRDLDSDLVDIYDYEGEAEAGNNPTKLNTHCRFYTWKQEGSLNNLFSDLRGYKWSSGSLLPKDNFVYRSSDQFNNNLVKVSDGVYPVSGLKCANDKKIMVVAGVAPGMKVTINYDATNANSSTKSIIWAAPSGAGSEVYASTAIIGESGSFAAPGETKIPSGLPIHIKSAEAGYIAFMTYKNMVIQSIKVEMEEDVPTYLNTTDFNSMDDADISEIPAALQTAIEGLDIVDKTTGTALNISGSGSDETPNRYAVNGNKVALELNGGVLDFVAPEGYGIKKITFEYEEWNEANSADAGAEVEGTGIEVDDETKTAVWTGSSPEVKVNIAGKTVIKKIKIEIGERDGEPLEVDVADGANLNSIVDNAYAQNPYLGKVTLNLAKDGKYTVDGSLFVSRPLVINGAEGAEIDASANDAPFILMRPLPEIGLNEQGAYEISEISIKDVKITGLKNRLFYANRQNYLIGKLSVENSIIQVDGSTPRSIFDFYCGGNYEELSIVNSTLYAEPSNAMRSGLISTQASLSVIELGGESQKLSIKNSTLYNIAKGMTPVLQQRHSQYYLSFELMDNVIVNCGEKGNFVAGLNEGHKSSEVKWAVANNVFNFDGEDTGKQEAYGNAIPSAVDFADAAKGNFTLSALNAAFQRGIGDPRWLVPGEGSVLIKAKDGSDLTALLEEAAGDKIPNVVVIKLDKNATVTVSKPIVFANSLYIDVPESDILSPASATIDASGLEGPMITTPEETPEEWVTGSLFISDVKVKGLKNALFASAAKNYFYETFAIMGCVVEQAGDATTLDFTKGSVAKDLLISLSTFYAPTATTKSFYSSQSGQKATEYNEGIQQRFAIFGSTMYNLAKDKNFFSHRQSNQKWLVYSVQNNIFVNCGKSGQVIKGINGGQQGTNPTWIVANNIFNFDGEDTSAKEETGDADEPVKGSAAGVMTFNSVETPDFGGVFTLAEGAAKPDAIGDVYHWTVTYNEIVTGIEAVKTAEGADLENAVIYNLNGQRIDKAQAKSGVFIVNGKKVVIK